MDSLKIRPDMKLTMEIHDENEGGKNILLLKSIVEEVTDDGCLLVQAPTYQGYYYNLPRYEPFTVFFITTTGKHVLNVRFLERISHDNLQLVVLQKLGFAEKFQLRNCYRLPISARVKIVPVLPEEEGKADELPFTVIGQTKDLSDGGMLVTTPEFFEKGMKIHITLELDKPETIDATVIRTTEGIHSRYKYDAAIKMDHTDMRQENRIYKYIVKKQIESKQTKKRPLIAKSKTGS
ncbi:MAG: flagellar brake protein [Oscillospiraceae bacterium]|nr:flagellar brake protein [Oscillospiraceae bacterium]